MGRGITETLHCDADGCDEWSVDYWALTAYSVNGVRITASKRAPGWLTSIADLVDYCPRHAVGGDE